MQYDAFISYRHAELDLYMAKRIHRKLETFRVPRAVARKSGKKRIQRVFRDQEELPIGSDLGENIEAALAQSEYLIVICSPRTPKSYWVQKEITTFIKMHDWEHVLAVLIEGEPEESFPQELLLNEEGNPVEPLAADVRGASMGERKRKLRTELLRLTAPLLHCSFDDLRQRHRERRIRRFVAAAGAVTMLALLFGAYNAYNAAMIQQNYREKQKNQSKYLAETSLQLLEEGDRRAAVLVVLEALPSKENDRPYVAQAQYALSRALYCYERDNTKMDRVLPHDSPVESFWLSKDGTVAVSIDGGSYVYVWDMERGRLRLQVPPRVDETGYVVRRRGAAVCEDRLIICEEKSMQCLSLDGGVLWSNGFSSSVFGFVYHEDTGRAACVGFDQVLFFDLRTGEQIGRMENTQEYFYSSSKGQMVFSREGGLFAVSHSISEEEQEQKEGSISVCNLESGECWDIAAEGSWVSSLSFTTDGNLAAASFPEGEILSDTDTFLKTGTMQKLDVRSGEVLWQSPYEHSLGNSYLACRGYEAEGDWRDEVLLAVNSRVYCWDAETGEQLAVTGVGSEIVNFWIRGDAKYGYVAERSGVIDFADLTTGRISTGDATLTTGKTLLDMQIGYGCFVLQSYRSSGLTVMRQEAGSMVPLEAYESGRMVSRMESSGDEEAYAAEFLESEGNLVRFYRSEDDALLSEWSEPEYSNIRGAFVDNTHYAIVWESRVVFVDVESGQQETLEVLPDTQWNWMDVINEAGSRAFLCGETADWSKRQYALVDLKNREILCRGELTDKLDGGILSRDGDQLYCRVREKGVCALETGTGRLTEIGDGEYQVLNGSSSDVEKAFALSLDGRYLAVSCQDNMLRVYDLEKRETRAEIPFAAMRQRFLMFLEEEQRILMQGDDYYLRVYDLKQEEFCHVSTGQYDPVREAAVDSLYGQIALRGNNYMILLDGESYEATARISGGKLYLPRQGRILCSEMNQAYAFPYQTLEMLLEEAERQFGQERLDDLERIRFHVD